MKDRLLLINQYTILQHLDPENTQYAEFLEIVTHGYEHAYSEITEWINEPMSADAGKLVYDVLSLYRAIEHYKSKNPEDTEVGEHAWGSFAGFDGNNETEFVTFTNFVINKQGKFSEQQHRKGETDGFNSHSPTLDSYRGMLRCWASRGKNVTLSRDDALEILNAA
jgi:uncharacterized protein YfbU (UPF0304 family)